MSNISFGWTLEHATDECKPWLRTLPKTIPLEVEGWRVLLCHGSPTSNTEYLFENRSNAYLRKFTPGGNPDARADIIVFGHTHVPDHRSLDGDSVQVEQVRLAYDAELACKRLQAAGLPEYFADYLRTGGNMPEV